MARGISETVIEKERVGERGYTGCARDLKMHASDVESAFFLFEINYMFSV